MKTTICERWCSI